VYFFRIVCSFAHPFLYNRKLIFKFITVSESFKPLYRICCRSIFILFSFLLLGNINATAGPDGKALFQSNCAQCHNPLKDATGPALKGIRATFPSKEWGYEWVKNPGAVLARGDKQPNDYKVKFGGAIMTPFPQLTHEEIDAIFDYVDKFEPPAPTKPKDDNGGGAAAGESSSWLYSVITLGLLILAVILWRANQSLRRASNEKDGIPNEKEIPLYRSKLVIAIVAILVFIFAGYWLVNGAINEGRQQNYQPKQPIFYSHKVHAGANQINCLYCHAGAEKSRQAMIPSSNICMNCHKQINSYSGDPLHDAEGNAVDANKQIQMLYYYAGWNPTTNSYKLRADGEIDAHPIEWTKIHNLPDHVYFNHSQHVKVGQVQCQRCHGQIQEMDEVYQFAPLSMGWCINCHRQTEVQFANNNYYSVYKKYHDELKAGKRKGVTEADMGGTECQKCHY
jgi:mono/diheme cytochrome c family protein